MQGVGDCLRAKSDQAIECLKVCLERGRQALELLAKQRIDEAVEVLKWRQAAFVNFRFMDQQLLEASNSYPSYTRSETLLSTARAVMDQDLSLNLEIRKCIQGLKNNKAKLLVARQKLMKFHSGRSQSPEFKYGI